MAGTSRAGQPPTRKLRFSSIEDCVEEVRRIADADTAGRLEATGSWTAGQVMAHVAAWIEYGYEGFPIGRPPFFVRWILRRQLKGIFANGMSPGVRIPRVPGGTTGMEPMETQEAAKRLLAALARLGSPEDAPFHSPAFGPLSNEDRVRLNLRHAELHLGFLTYPIAGE
jgi:hypothetical protein